MVTVPWTYKEELITEVPEGMVGFVYLISCESTVPTMHYIGCKQFYKITNPIMSKKAKKALLDKEGIRRKRKQVITESDWRTYTSSSTAVNKLIEVVGVDDLKFTILKMFDSKAKMSLFETYTIIDRYLKGDKRMINEWVSVKMRIPK